MTTIARNPSSPAELVEHYLENLQKLDLLRFITCGSVDDGKSTLIGRLLWESNQLFDDQISALQQESRKFGTCNGEIDYALLVDGLSAEREQGITIDVAYRFFATDKRRFIVADTPGHQQYTRNMATGASTAHVALLLVDARHGLQVQTRRHAYIASLMGIRHVALAVNKMDLIDYEQSWFEQIAADFSAFSNTLSFDSVTTLPVSALTGENISSRSQVLNWFNGPTLLRYLETIDVQHRGDPRFVFPVQWVNRPNADFRGYSGTIASGTLTVGDRLLVSRSGQHAQVASITTFDGDLPSANAGDAVTLTLDRDIDLSRGDILSRADEPLASAEQFEATLVWMSTQPGYAGRKYQIRLLTQWASASLTRIKHRIDVNTLSHLPASRIELNDICVATIALSNPVVFDSFADSPRLGAFILVDQHSRETVAAGLISHALRRAANIHHQALSVKHDHRAVLNGHPGRVVWFTGLSGSGKSTLANQLELDLHSVGAHTFLLDGDNIRLGLNRDLGFTEQDRIENIRRIAEVARLMADAGLIVLTAFISPFAQERRMARDLIGQHRFIEVHVSTPLEICEKRDPKGLYRKARLGELPNLTGIGSPYEPPHDPDFRINTDGDDVEQQLKRIADRLRTPAVADQPPRA